MTDSERGASSPPNPVVVDVAWAKAHLDDPAVRFVEVDVDTASYAKGHLPGAVALDWTRQLQDPVRRDVLSREQFEALMSAAGITRDTTVVLYGDNHNWFAAHAFWLFEMYGHPDVRLMDGGRRKWELAGNHLTTVRPTPSRTTYRASDPDPSIRALRGDVERGLEASDRVLVDVRSPREYRGEVLSPPGLSETAQRAGHIPGARNVPWNTSINDDGTFKSVEELRQFYAARGVTPERDVVTYCRIGERSSHSWFVLRHLLGFPRVRNYDGSWTEWGSCIGVPIENPSARPPDTSDVCR